MRRDPLARAVRPDKVTMAGVALTLGLYRSGRAVLDIPIWRMIAAPLAGVQARAGAVARAIGADADAVDLEATVGGGSLPGETLPSAGVRLSARSATRLLAALRAAQPAVIGRIEDGRVVLDLRTVDPGADATVAAAATAALESVA
jgi:L-seryl-tRNA(Ser) seleniumtransferase